MTKPDLEPVPLNEEALVENVELVDAILTAKQGEPMTAEAFMEWLDQT